LTRVLWPIFIYSYLELITNNYVSEASRFLKEFRQQFEKHHKDELRTLETITLPQQVLDNEMTKLYRTRKYRIPLNTQTYYHLITFLESNAAEGGSVTVYLLQTFCEVKTVDQGPIDQYSFEAIIKQAQASEIDDEDLQEGIPGAFTGVTNQDISQNNAVLRLGMMAMENELARDVQHELAFEDAAHPPELGKPSLVDEFRRVVKTEDTADAPMRAEVPLPPSRARDIAMEVQKVKESRDRFKIESRTGGVGPAVSVCMYTFHNTFDG
jgi:transcription initiation factor TFIID subunit 5